MNLAITPRITTNHTQPQKSQVKQNQSFGMYFPIYPSSVEFLRNDLKKVLPLLPEEIGKTLEQTIQKFLQKLGRNVVEHHNTPAQHAIYQNKQAITRFDIQLPEWLAENFKLQDRSLLFNMSKAKSEALQDLIDSSSTNNLEYVVAFDNGKKVTLKNIASNNSNLAQDMQSYFIEQKSQNTKTINADIDALVEKSKV